MRVRVCVRVHVCVMLHTRVPRNLAQLRSCSTLRRGPYLGQAVLQSYQKTRWGKLALPQLADESLILQFLL